VAVGTYQNGDFLKTPHHDRYKNPYIKLRSMVDAGRGWRGEGE